LTASTRIEYVPVRALSPARWDEVWALAERFTDTERATFEASVREKQEAVLVRDARSRRLVGIGSVDVYEVAHAGERRMVIYPGNTMFEPDVRGSNLVQRIGLRCFLRVRARHPRRPVFLFYDTYSYKSYLMLPRNFAEFWPRRDRPLPASMAAFMDELGRRRYGERWDPERRLCRRSGRKLRSWVATASAADLADPDIRFYVASNPGYTEGDMLAVLVPLHAANWLAVVRNAVRRLRGRGPAAGSTPAATP
jgi:hypothetical protein